jgi:hypothetical protein
MPALDYLPRSEVIEARTNSSLAMPIELLEEIIFEAWCLPLTRDERIDIWLSLTTVSHTILVTFIRIAMRDVHILTAIHARHYLRLIRPRASFAPDDSPLARTASAVAHRFCRSLTFHIDSRPDTRRFPDAEPALRLYADGDRAAEAVSSTLYLLSLVSVFVPGLRRVVLCYTDWGFDDVLDQCRILPLPAQVTALELRYAFSPRLWRVAAHARKHYGKAALHAPVPGVRWKIPDIVRLAVEGAPPAFVSTIVQMCPALHTLEVDGFVEQDETWTIPQGVRSLVLDSKPLLAGQVVNWWVVARMVGGDASCASANTMKALLSAPWQEYTARQRLKRLCSRREIAVKYL